MPVASGARFNCSQLRMVSKLRCLFYFFY